MRPGWPHLSTILIFAFFSVLAFLDINTAYAEEYRCQKTIGAYGAKDAGLYYPCGVALDSVGNIYVTDWRNKKVSKFNQEGKFILNFESKAKVYMKLKGPAGIAIDSNDNIYVVDQYVAKVFKYNTKGEYVGSFGNYGSASGKFLNPRGVACDGNNNIYVADHDNFRVQKFSPKGEYISEFKYMGLDTRKLARPRGVTCDANNNVYVVYSDINKVAVFTQEAKMIADYGEEGSQPGQFMNPRYAACDNIGNIYVTCYKNHRVQKFSKDMKLLTAFGGFGKKNENFRNPEGICVDVSGNVYVADALNDRISKWEPEEYIKHLNWAALFEKKAMIAEAIKEYGDILKIRPQDAKITSAIIDLSLKAAKKCQLDKDIEGAKKYYAEVLKLNSLNEAAIREMKDLQEGGREKKVEKKQNFVIGLLLVLAVLISMIMTFKNV